jgi:hypothetical protein
MQCIVEILVLDVQDVRSSTAIFLSLCGNRIVGERRSHGSTTT